MSRLKYYNPKMLKSLKWGSQLPWHLANADYKTVALIKHALMEVKMLQVTFAGKNNRWGSPLIHSSSVTSLLTVTSSVFRCVMLRPPTFAHLASTSPSSERMKEPVPGKLNWRLTACYYVRCRVQLSLTLLLICGFARTHLLNRLKSCQDTK